MQPHLLLILINRACFTPDTPRQAFSSRTLAYCTGLQGQSARSNTDKEREKRVAELLWMLIRGVPSFPQSVEADEKDRSHSDWAFRCRESFMTKVTFIISPPVRRPSLVSHILHRTQAFQPPEPGPAPPIHCPPTRLTPVISNPKIRAFFVGPSWNSFPSLCEVVLEFSLSELTTELLKTQYPPTIDSKLHFWSLEVGLFPEFSS